MSADGQQSIEPDANGPSLRVALFREGRGRYLTIRSRFVQVLGVRAHRQRAWVHAGPTWLPRGSVDEDLLDQLGKLLTAVIREDRFNEGALGDSFESGFIAAIARRSKALAEEAPSGP